MSSPSSDPTQTAPDLLRRDLADFGVARLRDQVFDAVLSLWRRRGSEGWTQKRVAENIGRDPAWVSRNLRAPGNWTLRTAGELIQGLGGEVEITVSGIEEPPSTLRNFDAYEGYTPQHASAVSSQILNIPAGRTAVFFDPAAQTAIGARDFIRGTIGANS